MNRKTAFDKFFQKSYPLFYKVATSQKSLCGTFKIIIDVSQKVIRNVAKGIQSFSKNYFA